MKRLTWVLENGEVDCNKSKDECFYLHEEGNGGCWACDLFPKIIERLAEVENILGEEYDIDRLRELVEADKDGRCVLLHAGKNSNEDGENALKSAMNTCYYHNNPVTRYIADAVAEKLVRESSNSALVENNDENPQNNYFMNRFMKVK